MRTVLTAALAALTLVVASSATPAVAAGADISPDTQTTTGVGKAKWTLSWSGGTGRFYPNWNGSLGYFAATSNFTYSFDSCSAYTVTQELDTLSGTKVVATATSKTTVKKTNPC